MLSQGLETDATLVSYVGLDPPRQPGRKYFSLLYYTVGPLLRYLYVN